MPWDVMERTTSTLLAQYDVRATGASAMARTLSGGNQQKFVLARELDGAHDALVVENPSRGLDFHATDAVHRALRAARARGAAIVLYSSDLDELLMLADRTLAMYDGALIPAECERNAIGLAMLGSTLPQATK
jgi:simple sugar transport system ATP-binding protein